MASRPHPSRRRRALRLGLIALSAGWVLIFATPSSVWLCRPLVVPADLKPADAIIILGSGVYVDGSLSVESLRRTVHGLRLFRRGLAPRIVISGGSGIPSRRAPADAMAQLARDLGVPSGALVVENGSVSTYENARYTRRIFEAHGWRTALLVTSAVHSLRAVRVFRKQRFEIFPAPVAFYGQYRFSLDGHWHLFFDACYEYMGLVYYRWRGWI